MKTNRTLNTLAFLSALGLLSPGVVTAQVAGSTDLRMNATAEALFHDNVKNSAAAAANGLALLSGTRSSALSLAEQNSVANQQVMNQISAKMVAQTTITSATEGASAIGTVRSADLMSLLSQLVGIATAGKQQETIVIKSAQ